MVTNVLRERVPIAAWLCAVLGVAALVMLNRATSGVCEHGEWSLFGIWAGELRYVADSSRPVHAFGYLFVGQHSVWLWIYTLLHIVVAVILGWAGAAVVGAARVLARRAGSTGARDEGGGVDESV